MSMRKMSFPNEPSEAVNNIAQSEKRPGDSLSRSKRSRPNSLLITPIQMDVVGQSYVIGFPREPTGVNCGRHDFIAMPPGQFLGEHDVPLADWKALVSKV